MSSLVEQRTNLSAVIDVVGGQCRCGDLAGVGVHTDVQLSPRPAHFGAMLLQQPLARAAKLLSTSRWTASPYLRGRGRGMSSVSARRRQRMVWSGTARAIPSK
jgi:hypothetical protein